MKILFFAGSSARNQALIEQAKTKYQDVIAVRWNHWDGQEDREDDYKRVIQALKAHPDARVIAKSYGGALVMRALSNHKIRNTDITILGALPTALKQEDIDTKNVSQRVQVIQNEYDPHGSYQEVKKYLSNVHCIKGNDTHTYKLP